jgi:hypothetical protein
MQICDLKLGRWHYHELTSNSYIMELYILRRIWYAEAEFHIELECVYLDSMKPTATKRAQYNNATRKDEAENVYISVYLTGLIN